MVEQNQQLQTELEQSMMAHRNDAEHVWEMMKQRDVQFQSDFRAMQTEFARKQAEWAEASRIEKEKYEASVRVEQQQSDEQRKAADAKWAALLKQLQDDHVKRQKEMEDEHVRREAEIEKKRAQQEERHAKQQRRLCVSQSKAQSTALVR